MAQITTVELAFCRQVASLARMVPQNEPVQKKYQSVAIREFPRVVDEVGVLEVKLERYQIAMYLTIGFGSILLLALTFISFIAGAVVTA